MRFWARRISHQRALGGIAHRVTGAIRAGIVLNVEHREEWIVVETERYRITGLLSLPREGYRSRLSDYLNSAERTFLPLRDAEILPLEGGPGEKREFIAVSMAHLVLAMPADSVPADEQAIAG